MAPTLLLFCLLLLLVVVNDRVIGSFFFFWSAVGHSCFSDIVDGSVAIDRLLAVVVQSML
jgi:hypothetical protein